MMGNFCQAAIELVLTRFCVLLLFAQPIDKGEGRFVTNWDSEGHKFTLQLYFNEGGVAASASSMGAAGAPKRQTRAISAGVLA